ncbi:MAG: SMP-30/gluconolactonase/LRE family protein, partial [Thiohalorhabdaceae bacterium]
MGRHGRLLGQHRVQIRVDYIYKPVYYGSRDLWQRSFARLGTPGTTFANSQRNQTITLSREWSTYLSVPRNPKAQGLAGWTFGPHHVYSPTSKVLARGDGTRRSADQIERVLTEAGVGRYTWGASRNDGGQATDAALQRPADVAVAADGAVYIADPGDQRVRRVSPDGTITTIAGTGAAGFGGDGGPADQAQLNGPQGLALGPDGGLYIADTGNHRIRRVGTDGYITTAAGTGSAGYGGDGGAGRQAQLSSPHGLALDDAGNLYIADSGNHRIRELAPSGIIRTVAGTGTSGSNGDNGPAAQAQLSNPRDVAVGPEGAVYVADRGNRRIRRFRPGGTITSPIQGGSGWSGRFYRGGSELASEASLDRLIGLAVGPDDQLYLADRGNRVVRRTSQPLPAYTGQSFLVPSEDGERLFAFDAQGRHLRTLNAQTQGVLYRFEYNDQGRLKAIIDGDGNTTRIERSADGTPTALIAPHGQRTELAVDGN